MRRKYSDMEMLWKHADELRKPEWVNELKHTDWLEKFKDSDWKGALPRGDRDTTTPIDSADAIDPSTEATEETAAIDTADTSTSGSVSIETTDETAATETADASTSTDITPVTDPVEEAPTSDAAPIETTDETAATDTADTSTDSTPVIDATEETPTSDAVSSETTEETVATDTVDASTSEDSTPVADPIEETPTSDAASTETTEETAATDTTDATTQEPAPGLTHTTTAIRSEYDGQVIENLDIYVTKGDAVTITHDNVVLRNCRIHHVEGDGVSVSGATGVRIENTEVINADPPEGIDPETSADIINIKAENSANLTVQNTTVREGSTGIYLFNSPGAELSHVDGYDFHGPFPRGQFVQFNNSGNSTLTDFYAVNNPDGSHPEDIVSVYASPNTTISNGVIDGNNSVTGVGVMFENGSTGGRVENVDAIRQANGAFSSYVGDVTFDDTRSFDGINEDQGRGLPSSNGLIWNVSSGGVSILNSTYTDPGNPSNIVWDRSKAVVADVAEDPSATPMAHIDNQFAWDYAA